MFEKVPYYIKNFIIDSWFVKWLVAGLSAVMIDFATKDMLLYAFIIFIGRSFLMAVGIMAGRKTEGFKRCKVGDGVFRLIGYYMMLFLGYSMSKAWGGDALTKLFYFAICLDITKRFVVHAQTLNISVSDWFISFLDKARNRLSNKALNSIGLTDDLDDKPTDKTEQTL